MTIPLSYEILQDPDFPPSHPLLNSLQQFSLSSRIVFSRLPPIFTLINLNIISYISFYLNFQQYLTQWKTVSSKILSPCCLQAITHSPDFPAAFLVCTPQPDLLVSSRPPPFNPLMSSRNLPLIFLLLTFTILYNLMILKFISPARISLHNSRPAYQTAYLISLSGQLLQT